MNHKTNQEKLVAALRDPRRYPHAAKNVRVIETHISWVLLAGQYAYKIKKAVDLGFLNYANLEARRFCCEEEIRLNRAPEIYLDVVSIGGSSDDPKFGAQPAIEYAVRMRRFASGCLMDHLLMRGKLTSRHIDSLAATISRFHAGLPAVDLNTTFGTPETIRAEAKRNFEQMQWLLTEEADRECIASLARATESEFALCESIFEARRIQGFVRECHGDLHLGNIALIDDKPVPFDCIEFNPALRWIDVMDEVAFAMMDLLHRGHPEFAWRFLNGILESSGDYAGVSVLRFYLAFRAVVRAKVCAIRASQADISKRAKAQELEACRSYLALARQCLALHRPAPPTVRMGRCVAAGNPSAYPLRVRYWRSQPIAGGGAMRPLPHRSAPHHRVVAALITDSSLNESDVRNQWRVGRASARHVGLKPDLRFDNGLLGLIITHGLPGSGKTTFSQFALEQMGAIRIRSDVERKRLYGLGALESSRSSAGNIYGQDATEKTYARLHELAQALLEAGYTVIVDAAFLKREERERFHALATKLSAPFAIASLQAKDRVLFQRLRQRRDDASEADVDVLKNLQAGQQPLSADELAWSANFTTEEAPDSNANSENWNRLVAMLSEHRLSPV